MTVTRISGGIDATSGQPKADPAKFAASRMAAITKADQTADERLELSKSVYLDKGAPTGWHRETGAELQAQHLDPALFTPTTSNFRAALFRGPAGQAVLAFKGTEGFTSLEDWKNNLEQGFGIKSDYYSRAISLAQQVVHVTGGHVEMTGHSLGGGLAAAAGLVTQSRTTTFDAAGLNPETAARYHVSLADATKPMKDGRPLIDRYDVKGEILDQVQHAAPAFLSIVPGLLPMLVAAGREPQRAQGVAHMLDDPHPLSAKERILSSLAGPGMEVVDLVHAKNEHLPPAIKDALKSKIAQDQKNDH